MRNYQFYQLDVFTKNKFEGNPLAVFPEAEGIADERDAENRQRDESFGNGFCFAVGKSVEKIADFYAAPRTSARRSSGRRNVESFGASRRYRRRRKTALSKSNRN